MTGPLTADAMLSMVRAARADPRWSNNYNFLTVMTHARLADVSADDAAGLVRDLAELDTAREDGKRKRAAVVCTDELATALLVFYEYTSKADRKTLERYFKSESEARIWLAEID